MDKQRKGGAEARRAAMLGSNPRFWIYLDHRYRWEKGLTPEQLPDGTCSPEDAADFIRQRCGVSSRAEIDHDVNAGFILGRIAGDYTRWERRQRRAG